MSEHGRDPPQIESGKGYIAAGDSGGIVSKYTLQWSWIDPKSGIPVPLTLNINADSPIPSFKSPGAPDENSLDVQYIPAKGQPYGLSQFRGTIGAGRIYIEIQTWDIIVRGAIEGGPKAGVNFVGNGNWNQ